MYTPDFFDATCLKLYLLSNVPFNEQSKLHEYTPFKECKEREVHMLQR